MYRLWRQFDFYACLTKNKSSSELREALQTCKNKINKNSLSSKVFPGSQPGKYFPLPTDFELESRPSPAFLRWYNVKTRDVRKSLQYLRSQKKPANLQKL